MNQNPYLNRHGRPKRITYEERVKIEELLKKGIGPSKVSRLTGISLNGLKKELTKGGGTVNYTAEAAQAETIKRKRVYKGGFRKPFEPGQAEDIHEKYKHGWSVAELSKHFGMGYRRIIRSLDDTDVKDQRRYTMTFDERLCIIEMQMDIILEQIRSLHDTISKNK